MKSVVVFDPNGVLPVGELIEGDSVGVARRRNVVMLPADDYMYFNASPGFAYRPWGSGIVFDAMQPRRDCPMVVSVHPSSPHVYWAVQLRQIRAGEQMTGRIRLVGNAAAGAMSVGMTQEVLMPTLESLQQKDGACLVFTGRNQVSVQQEGQFGLSLYGVCRNVRLTWSVVAVSSALLEPPQIVSV